MKIKTLAGGITTCILIGAFALSFTACNKEKEEEIITFNNDSDYIKKDDPDYIRKLEESMIVAYSDPSVIEEK